MKLRDRENLSALGIFLGAVALTAAFALALVSQWTAEPIRKAAEQNRLKAFYRLRLPEFDQVGKEICVDGIKFYPVTSGGKNVGFIGQGEASGYGGRVELLVGFDVNGKITAVQILKHKETPGLGANVCERKFQRTIYNLFADAPEIPENRWLDQFDSRVAGNSGKLLISKDGGDVAFLTGATVTSRAVTQGVSNICKAFSAGGVADEKGE